MGLFDKKYCDICGEKIGLLGNRKLEDGNLCKNCAKKLSPFFSERRHSTVEDIKKQLEYRIENEQKLNDFHPNMTFGESKRIYVDRNGFQFIVTSDTNWRNTNPDLIRFDMVKSINTNIRENKTELYYRDDEGNRKSYTPRRYKYDYAFNVTLSIDSPWFDKIELELSSGNRPDSPYTDLYRRYDEQMHTLSSVLRERPSNAAAQSNTVHSAPKTREDEIIADTLKNSSWVCKECGCANSGTENCQNCGAYINDEKLLANAKALAQATIMYENAVTGKENAPQSRVCSFCGSSGIGKFCENCGASLS